jgi:putative heme-binding domain-containing protein
MKRREETWLASNLIGQRVRWAVFGLTCAASFGFAQTANSRQPTGRELYETVCASCHGLNGNGGERAANIVSKPEIVKLSDSQILKILHDGRPQAGMPPFAGLGAARLAELLRYLRQLQGKGSSAEATANVGEGKELFSGKGGCARCHSVGGVGGFLGPDLSDYGDGHSPNDIGSAILSADKRPAVRKGLAKATTNGGQQISGLVRNEDNFSLQLQGLDGTFYMLDKSRLSDIAFEVEPVMPNDYGSRLSKEELDQIVAYLVSVANAK